MTDQPILKKLSLMLLLLLMLTLLLLLLLNLKEEMQSCGVVLLLLVMRINVVERNLRKLVKSSDDLFGRFHFRRGGEAALNWRPRARSIFALAVGPVVKSFLGLVEARRLLVVGIQNPSFTRHRVVDRDRDRVRTLTIFGLHFQIPDIVMT